MTYEVLARKWRPKTFANCVGQEHVLQALINALNLGRLHHAYLFTGTRGVGKTTFARIVAKCLNCEQGISASPCGECSACVEIDSGRFVDLIEVDAASRTKVEDTRELLNNVQYAPARGRFKVYLIDEVHMLSGHSFNALLKTLEEPPPHVKFLLATTDPQKLPITVLSRCLQFNLKNLEPDLISHYLEEVLKKESINFEQEAIVQLGFAANGSMRDGLSLLDQAISFSGTDILSAKDVHTMLGTIEQHHITHLLHALSEHDGKTLMAISDELASLGANFQQALSALLSSLHQISMTQTIPAYTANDDITSLAEKIAMKDAQLFYQIALIGQKDLPLAPTQKVGFEMVLLRMLAFKPITDLKAAPKEKDAKLQTAKPAVSIKDSVEKTEKKTKKLDSKPIHSERIQLTQDNWKNIVSKLALKGMTLVLADHCSIKSSTDNSLNLLLEASQAPLNNDQQRLRLQESLNKYYNKAIQVVIEIAEEEIATPAKAKQLEKDRQQQCAQTAIENDPHVQSLLQSFSGNLDKNSIKPIVTNE